MPTSLSFIMRPNGSHVSPKIKPRQNSLGLRAFSSMRPFTGPASRQISASSDNFLEKGGHFPRTLGDERWALHCTMCWGLMLPGSSSTLTDALLQGLCSEAGRCHVHTGTVLLAVKPLMPDPPRKVLARKKHDPSALGRDLTI